MRKINIIIDIIYFVVFENYIILIEYSEDELFDIQKLRK
jgi:hypothetical protein